MARRRRGQFPTPKKEKGQWKIRYYTDQAQPDGTVRRVKKTKCLGRADDLTLREAKKEAQRFLQPINDVEPGIEHSEKTVNELIQRWRRDVKPNLKRSTQDGYEWAFKRIAPRFGPMPVSEIEKGDVQAFLTASGGELAPESIYDLRNRLSGLLSSAEEWGWVQRGTHPVRGRFKLPQRVAARKRRILEPEGFQNLVMALGQPYSAIVMLAMLSGLRKGEIAALRWDDIGPGYVEVDEAVYKGTLDTPKSRKSSRKVAIGQGLQLELENWRKQAKFTEPEDFVFSVRTNSPIDLKNATARHVKPACAKLGLPLMSWHDFRHTYTTWGRRAGVKAETMRDQLGHESVQVTLDIYSHADSRDAEAAQIEAYGWASGTLSGT